MLFCCKDSELRDHWLTGLADAVDQIETVFSVSEVQEFLESRKPEMVLLDLETSDLEKHQVSGLISSFHDIPVFTFATFPKPEEGVVLVGAGARGYGNRQMHPEVLHQAVQVVRSGEIWLGSELILHLIKGSAAVEPQSEPAEKGAGDKLESLTRRELEIAGLVAKGESNKLIAYDLGITERTVKAHLSTIFKKTDTRDRLQLALLVNGSKV
ncbi:MAG: response regulator transcription factor [Candidatus Sedimenticola sp. 20ELBAFRAG]